MKANYETKVELNGVFLGYVKTPLQIPALLVEKGVKPEDIDGVRFSSVVALSSTMKKNCTIAINEATPKPVSKKRGRRKKEETVEVEKIAE